MDFDEEMEKIEQIHKAIDERNRKILKPIADVIGAGELMRLGQTLWREALVEDMGVSGGEFAIGPCVAATVPCGCEQPHKCEWCCGCGWLTKHVKTLQESLGELGREGE